ncbi:MAG: hypothetical protein JXR03_04580 [Cyclobacteriaceae bacterium]
MKNRKIIAICLVLMVLASGCTRDEDGLTPAGFSNTAEVFTDNFIGLGTDFYFPYLGAKPDVFSVDTNEGYESDASIRIDVPNANDPTGNFAGAIFRIDGAGRDLSGYDALTFWAKASQAVTVNEFGFGQNFFGDEFRVVKSGVDLTTNWKKYIIPIPDPSKLREERGVFQFAAGGIGAEGQEVGYTFWVDELKFEKLGTVAQPRPAILSGADEIEVGFIGGTVAITGFTQTFNLASGQNATVIATPAYFDFQSSDNTVATIDNTGAVSIIGDGEAVITASVAGVVASGSKTIRSLGEFIFASDPVEPQSNVISIFSDTYTDSPVALISNFGAFQNSTLTQLDIGGKSVLNYQNVNFFGIIFNGNIPTIDGSDMTTLHMDILIPGSVSPGASLSIALRNVGPNGFIETNEFTGQPTGDDTEVSTSPGLTADQWISVDFDITGLADRSALGQIVFVSPDAGPNNFYVDNIYFFK